MIPAKTGTCVSAPFLTGTATAGIRRKAAILALARKTAKHDWDMNKWELADSAACECGKPEQTADHIINSCPLQRPPSEAGVLEVGPLARAWLQQTDLTI